MGKKRNGKQKQEPLIIPKPQEISRRHFLGWAAAVFGIAVGGAGTLHLLCPKKEILEDILETDFYNETVLKQRSKGDFITPTPEDEQTIAFFVDKAKIYYAALDKTYKQQGKLTEDESYQQMRLILLNPLLEDFWQKNIPLRELFISKTEKGATKYDSGQLFDLLQEYFQDKGYHFGIKKEQGTFGTTQSCFLYKADKITLATARLWGNDISKELVYACPEPKVPHYGHYFDRENCRYNGIVEKVIYLFPDASRESFKNLRRQLLNKKPSNNPETVLDLANLLTLKTLQKYLDDPSELENLAKRSVKSTVIHELTHVLFQKIYNQSFENPEIANKNELAAFLTEMKNDTDEFVYMTIANLISAPAIQYQQAREYLLELFKSELLENREKYSNIEYTLYDRTHDNRAILSQIPDLTVPQIKTIAAKGFRQYFPEMCKTG